MQQMMMQTNPMMQQMMMRNPMMMQQRMMMFMQMQQQRAALQNANANPVAAAAVAAANNNMANGSGVKSPALMPTPVITAIPKAQLNAAMIARNEEVARTIYVGNLNPMIQDTHLRQFFSACGDINQVKVVVGNDGQRHGFIEFAQLASVTTAQTLNGSTLGDRVIKVSHANNPIVKDTADQKKIQDAMDKVKKAQEAIKKRVKNRSRSRSRSRGSSSSRSRSRSSSSSRSRSRSRGRRKKRSRRSRSRSRKSKRRSKRSRSRDRRSRRRRSRSRSDSPKKKKKSNGKKDDKDGLFWDGFQWLPKPTPIPGYNGVPKE